MQKSLLIPLFLWLHFLPSSTGNKQFYKGGDDYEKKAFSHVKLFVFGDSYVDTGNWEKVAPSWKMPYGMTYPGKPAGRFSDGRILTDYIASYLHIASPIPYQQWNLLSDPEKSKNLEFGMNFAYGGTGVFNTDISRPNMTSQIDNFERLLNQYKVFSIDNFNSSIALVSVGGNDYSNYLKHPTNMTVPEFTKSVINQLTLDLERIRSLGVKKIMVTKMEPIGCMPAITFLSGYTNCTASLNEIASFHNILLQQSVDLLNSEIKDEAFLILDLYAAFMSSLLSENQTSVDSLKPCCEGITANYECGSMEGNVTKYSVCKIPNSTFFWDKVHPTQNGWYQVYMAIIQSLKIILNT